MDLAISVSMKNAGSYCRGSGNSSGKAGLLPERMPQKRCENVPLAASHTLEINHRAKKETSRLRLAAKLAPLQCLQTAHQILQGLTGSDI